ncbi:MAG TPA: hypothetical protein VLB67_02400 [Acidimicrobiia bacterium]|nr:hypothetical protein [Acidimicrobiia bacterium]
MSGPVLVVFVGVLVALLLGMLALLIWQEGKKRSFDLAPSYVVPDVVAHVARELEPQIAERLGPDGIERIIDWEVRYLLRDGGPGAVAGGTPESIRYIIDRMVEHGGPRHDPGDVGAVLALEADYLRAVGVVGERVDDPGQDPIG